jgi:hypothetical protein
MHLKLVLLEVCSSQYIVILNNYEVSPHEYNSLDAIKAILICISNLLDGYLNIYTLNQNSRPLNQNLRSLEIFS